MIIGMMMVVVWGGADSPTAVSDCFFRWFVGREHNGPTAGRQRRCQSSHVPAPQNRRCRDYPRRCMLDSMFRRWKPSAAQRRAFAERMADPAQRAAYEARKAAKAEKRRAGSSFDYQTAGGSFVPTDAQYATCGRIMDDPASTQEERDAAALVASALTATGPVRPGGPASGPGHAVTLAWARAECG